MPVNRLGAAMAVLTIANACGGGSPTAPGTPPPATRLTLTCSASSLLAGDSVVCGAMAGLQNVSMGAVWTSSDPSIVQAKGLGLFVGMTDGQATLTASYSSQSVSAVVAVHLEDVLRVRATAEQGSFETGTSVTLWLMGFYGVASGTSGVLTLVVRDQTGARIHISAPLIVSHGADQYVVSTSFMLSPGVTRVCPQGYSRLALRRSRPFLTGPALT